jgi:hypothetical protein
MSCSDEEITQYVNELRQRMPLYIKFEGLVLFLLKKYQKKIASMTIL